MHPQKVSVWYGFHVGGVIGHYFFENAVGNVVTGNGELYRVMITDFHVTQRMKQLIYRGLNFLIVLFLEMATSISHRDSAI